MALELVLTLSIEASVLAYGDERFAHGTFSSRGVFGKRRAGYGQGFVSFVFSTLVKRGRAA
jgi:hypothetical protein